ncbi:MAG: hypothetical protein K2I18_08685 [Paramuribaculum sp.]|nr:hypothetical protein [Paramuribaculum sp.]
MNKLTIAILSLFTLMLTGCENIAINAQPLPNVINHQPQNHHCMSRIYFDGHYYIKYDTGGRVSSPSITHDPDCPCREKGGEI